MSSDVCGIEDNRRYQKIPEETCEYVPTVSFGAAEFCGL
jgi:hypothetical protein